MPLLIPVRQRLIFAARSAGPLLLGALLTATMANCAQGQSAPVPPAPGFTAETPAQASQAGGDKASDEKKAPVEEMLTTRDGVRLLVVYLAGSKGKDTVPIVLLHGYKGSHKDYADLAYYLQAQGHAVLIPDLRGHGGSTKTAAGNVLTPSNVDIRAMATGDMEAVNTYLLAKNDKQELNIEKLCVVGAEMGAVVAGAWAQLDWSWPMLATGKQGQDVKALVLLSPAFSYKNLRLSEAMGGRSPVTSQLSILLIVGDGNRTALKDANRMYDIFKRYHHEPPPGHREEEQDLFYKKLPTKLQGTELQTVKKPTTVAQLIAQFVTLRLVNQKEFSWKSRGTSGK